MKNNIATFLGFLLAIYTSESEKFDHHTAEVVVYGYFISLSLLSAYDWLKVKYWNKNK